ALHRFGREARPDDEAVACRIARRDAQAEREFAEDAALGAQDRRGGKAGERGPGEEVAAVEHGWAPWGESPPLITQSHVSSMTDARHYNHIRAIHSAIAIIITFSVSETKPSGTLLLPPTQAHL